jgi:hypothetical protein
MPQIGLNPADSDHTDRLVRRAMAARQQFAASGLSFDIERQAAADE